MFQVAHHGLRNTPGCLYQSQVDSELYFGRFQTDELKNRTLIEKVFVGETRTMYLAPTADSPRGGKRSKVSPRGALNLPAARFPAN
jgi:hypothetical protein